MFAVLGFLLLIYIINLILKNWIAVILCRNRNERYFYLLDYEPQLHLNDTSLPLDESNVTILDNNATFLKENIDCENGLLDCMVRKGALTHKEIDSIQTHSNTYDKNEALLGIIRRGNQRQYGMTAEALNASNQENIADLLIHGGGKRVLLMWHSIYNY